MNIWRCPECGSVNAPNLCWCRTCSEPRPEATKQHVVGRWVRLYVDTEKEPFWHRAKYLKIWVWLLANAAWKDTTTLDGIAVRKGSLLVSVATVAYNCQTTEQVVRICLEKLKASNKITSASTNRGTMITISDYESYEPLGGMVEQIEQLPELDIGDSGGTLKAGRDGVQAPVAPLTNPTTGGRGNG